ncbi:histidinol-phosphate transaminase [Mangrovibacterium diazotrophicum]|uniref:Histidinol-phosphate aminotransferase n=1 Tax=Mangrovibacterium diazotrophicum TaxID=1261403 RepID=A0A419W6X8_9BACT|nr:histidinol-phosphate transaminase [Mangrovibacterium diazotrophicum]RKD91231.1 histidinol-phosphate aminotransferase [Mangrovibacterium diazotrophicum]
MNLDKLLRANIKNLKPYSSARDEFSGEAMVFLDANENPYNAPYNRYPDPLQRQLKEKISAIKGCTPDKIFLGNGSDEPIDLLFRAFCEPGKDNIVSIDPTYGMYQVAADINNIEVRKVRLKEDYSFSADELLAQADENSKLAFVCSPNNPTANLMDQGEMLKLILNFKGLVVVDEAYIDFAPGASLLPELDKYPNLVILQTFSKAWGMAGIRLGMAFASPEIISIFNKIKYPYNINILTQQKALELIEQETEKNAWVETLLAERSKLGEQLKAFPFVVKIYPSDANFLLIKMHDARGIYDYLVENGVIVRDRSKVILCDDSLRITVGSPEENEILLEKLNDLI